MLPDRFRLYICSAQQVYDKEKTWETKIKTSTTWQPGDTLTSQENFEVDSSKARKISLTSE